MKAYTELPAGYKEIFSIDLQKDKRLALLVNGLALLIGVALVLPMHFVIPLGTLFDAELFELEGGIAFYFLRFAVLAVAGIAYLILHELVHGIAMHICGTKKVKYGFTGLYAFAGSEDYYDKSGYIFIALAPVVLWGVVLAAINIFVPVEWFWVVYLLQVMNLSGAAGDLYVTVKFSRLPKDILVCDNGVGMTVFTKE